MKRLYLIRRAEGSIIGPLTSADFINGLRRLDFGAQDEVSGSCGEWVRLEDSTSLKRRYAELYNIVNKELGRRNSTVEDRVRIKPQMSWMKKVRPSKLPRSLFFATGMASVVLFYFLIQSMPPATSVSDEVVDAWQSKNMDKFAEAMNQAWPVASIRANKSRKAYQDWIPYIRAYAYLVKDGAVDGFSVKLLRGLDAVPNTPNDCSQKFWQEQWRNSEAGWNDFLQGKNLKPENLPLQLLFWDPAWIARRPSSGWLEPKGYYHACLLMAEKALTVFGENPIAQDFSERLRVVMARASRSGESPGSPKSPLLGYLSCMDKAISESALQACSWNRSDYSVAMQNYLQIYRSRVSINIRLKAQSDISSESLQQFSQFRSSIGKTDAATGFNYSQELKLYDAILQSNGRIKQAVATATQQGWINEIDPNTN